MTAPRPQLHCDHECVCWWYYDHKKSGSASACESYKCHHRLRIPEIASHSSAPSEQDIRKDEREKVLDEICEILKREWNNANNLDREYRDQAHNTVLHIRNQIAELRSKQGEQQAQQAGLK